MAGVHVSCGWEMIVQFCKMHQMQVETPSLFALFTLNQIGSFLISKSLRCQIYCVGVWASGHCPLASLLRRHTPLPPPHSIQFHPHFHLFSSTFGGSLIILTWQSHISKSFRRYPHSQGSHQSEPIFSVTRRSRSDSRHLLSYWVTE